MKLGQYYMTVGGHVVLLTYFQSGQRARGVAVGFGGYQGIVAGVPGNQYWHATGAGRHEIPELCLVRKALSQEIEAFRLLETSEIELAEIEQACNPSKFRGWIESLSPNRRIARGKKPGACLLLEYFGYSQKCVE